MLNVVVKLEMLSLKIKLEKSVCEVIKNYYGQIAIYDESQTFYSIYMDQIMIWLRISSLILTKLFDMTIHNGVLNGH